jgi:hypothetical protein
MKLSEVITIWECVPIDTDLKPLKDVPLRYRIFFWNIRYSKYLFEVLESNKDYFGGMIQIYGERHNIFVDIIVYNEAVVKPLMSKINKAVVTA